MSVKIINEEKKEISEKDIKDIVQIATEYGSINFNPDLYSPEELYEITLAINKASQNLNNCAGQTMSILRHRDRKLAHKAFITIRNK